MKKQLIITGVGSRETPQAILSIMKDIGEKIAEAKYVLRTGGAQGADSAFEQGYREYFSKMDAQPDLTKLEVYLPWKGFEKNTSELISPSSDAMEIASRTHPVWTTLTQGAQKLHARNVHQVLGHDCKSPSDLLICWAKINKYGNIEGGTATAIKLAIEYKVPVINLAEHEFRWEHITDYIKGKFKNIPVETKGSQLAIDGEADIPF